MSNQRVNQGNTVRRLSLALVGVLSVFAIQTAVLAGMAYAWEVGGTFSIGLFWIGIPLALGFIAIALLRQTRTGEERAYSVIAGVAGLLILATAHLTALGGCALAGSQGGPSLLWDWNWLDHRADIGYQCMACPPTTVGPLST